MFRTIISNSRRLSTALHQLMCSMSLALMVTITANAQSVIDSGTPSGLAPGASVGSYALSDFDISNFYSGSLNFRLPLQNVGARGGAQYTMMLPIEQKWVVEHIFGTPEYQIPTYNWWDNLRPGYGPGVLHARRVVGSSPQCEEFGTGVVNRRTRVTFSAPDGTEYELRDTLTGGGDLNSACNSPALRGRVFATADGTAATFISDSPVTDPPGQGYSDVFYFSGFFMTRDGTRYRIDNGLVSWMRDRTGNRLTFMYDPQNRVTNITDSINRQITITYDVNDGATYGLCDRITFVGFGGGGAQRIIRISKSSLGSALRQSQEGDLTTPQTYGSLVIAVKCPKILWS